MFLSVVKFHFGFLSVLVFSKRKSNYLCSNLGIIRLNLYVKYIAPFILSLTWMALADFSKSTVSPPLKSWTRQQLKQTNKQTNKAMRVENLTKILPQKMLPSISTIGHMVSSSECYQMCIIGRGWHGNTASAPCIYMTQLISELLKTVCCKGVIVVQNVIVCGEACSLRRNQ